MILYTQKISSASSQQSAFDCPSSWSLCETQYSVILHSSQIITFPSQKLQKNKANEKKKSAVIRIAVLQRLRIFGVNIQMLAYVKAFLYFGTFWDRIPGATSSPRSVTQGVPQGSVLSPLLFNVVMAALSKLLQQEGPFPVQIFIYADEVALWCVEPTGRARKIRRELPEALNSICYVIEELDLTHSVERTTALLYRPRGRAPERWLPFKLSSLPVQKVKNAQISRSLGR